MQHRIVNVFSGTSVIKIHLAYRATEFVIYPHLLCSDWDPAHTDICQATVYPHIFRGAAFPWQKDLTIGFIVANKHNNADTSQRLSHLKYFFTLLCNFICFISAEGIRKSYVLILFPAGVIGNILSFMVRNYKFYFWRF